MTWRRGRAVAASLALAAATGIWGLVAAPPASAYVCSFGIERPGPGFDSGEPMVAVQGPFVTRQGLGERIVEVVITDWPGGPAPGPYVVNNVPPDRFNVPLGPLTRNGTYTARVTARHAGLSTPLNCADGLGPEGRATEQQATVSFGVSVRAKPPVNVRARFNAAPRTATVTWERSVDPDVAGYIVSRQVGSDAATSVDVQHDVLSWTDTALPGRAATVVYSVQATRNGPRANTTSERSPLVAAPPLAVPAPPAGPSATTATTSGGGGTTTTLPFLLAPSVVGSTSPTIPDPLPNGPDVPGQPSAAGPDDGTYRPLVPYGPQEQSGESLLGEEAFGDQAVVGAGGDGDRSRTPQLAYVASGLLSTVVAAHVLWLRRASRPAPSFAARPSAPLEAVEASTGAPPPVLRPAPPPASPPHVDASPSTRPPAVDARPPLEPPTPVDASAFAPVILVDAQRRDRRRRPVRAARRPEGATSGGRDEDPTMARDPAPPPASALPVDAARPARPSPGDADAPAKPPTPVDAGAFAPVILVDAPRRDRRRPVRAARRPEPPTTKGSGGAEEPTMAPVAAPTPSERASSVAPAAVPRRRPLRAPDRSPEQNGGRAETVRRSGAEPIPRRSTPFVLEGPQAGRAALAPPAAVGPDRREPRRARPAQPGRGKAHKAAVGPGPTAVPAAQADAPAVRSAAPVGRPGRRDPGPAGQPAPPLLILSRTAARAGSDPLRPADAPPAQDRTRPPVATAPAAERSAVAGIGSASAGRGGTMGRASVAAGSPPHARPLQEATGRPDATTPAAVGAGRSVALGSVPEGPPPLARPVDGSTGRSDPAASADAPAPALAALGPEVEGGEATAGAGAAPGRRNKPVLFIKAEAAASIAGAAPPAGEGSP